MTDPGSARSGGAGGDRGGGRGVAVELQTALPLGAVHVVVAAVAATGILLRLTSPAGSDAAAPLSPRA